MRRIFLKLIILLSLTTIALVAYGAKGYYDAYAQQNELQAKANALIVTSKGGDVLGAQNLRILLRVQDPSFYDHLGVDFSTPGAGKTTITQSASKRLAFSNFKPGIRKIRQTGFALGLEKILTKDQILALWLNSVEMGNGPNGWMVGFFNASDEIYGRAPNQLKTDEFINLVAVLIAPSNYDLLRENKKLQDRVSRIKALIANKCKPLNHNDVWLRGCANL